MLRAVTLALVLSVFTSFTLQAQEEEAEPPRGFFISSWQCPQNSIAEIFRAYDSLTVPIEQGLVNEGMLAFAGIYRHDWGDEWNVNRYRIAQDRDAVLTAIAEVNRRFEERHPDLPPGPLSQCTAHKDNIYFLGPTTAASETPEAAAEPATGLFISSWKCSFDQIDEIFRSYDSLTVPIEQELVNEGIFVGAGMYRHDWGDEWNVNYYRLAQDRDAVFAAIAEVGRRFQERHPDAGPGPLAQCMAHKDNIYFWGPRTSPPPTLPTPNQ